MGSHGSISTELKLRADDLKQFLSPTYVKGMTRSDVWYGRFLGGMEPLHGQEVLAIVGRFRHHIDGSGMLLSGDWQGLTYDLAAFYGSVNSAQLKFSTVTSHNFERWMNHHDHYNDALMQLFVLGPGELVRALDISWVDNKQLKDRRFVGMRLQTNQRQSPWFGQRSDIVKTVTAPQGYFINAFQSLYAKTGRWELGLRLCPVLEHCGRALAAPDIALCDKSETMGKASSEDGMQTEFQEKHENLRAIVVECDSDGIMDLHALSNEQYNRHLAKREEPLPFGQHIVFLRTTEHLIAVDVFSTDHVVSAIRFHTNLCSSPWYGKLGDSVNMMHTFRPPTKQGVICGFHGTFGETRLGSMGVFYCSPVLREELKTVD